MIEGNGQPALYAVKFSVLIKQTILDLHHQALTKGQGQQFLSALRTIRERLRREPLTFGNPPSAAIAEIAR